MRRLPFVVLLLLAFAGAAQAAGPSWVQEFRTVQALPSIITNSRSGNAFDYGCATADTVITYTGVRWPACSQRTLTRPLGLGSWLSFTNRFHASTPSPQNITVTNGAPVPVWCDDFAAGTTVVTLSGALTGTITANGWAGGMVGTAASTTLTMTWSGAPSLQCVVGSNTSLVYPPIPTTTTNVAVNADVTTMPISAVNGFNSQQGTLVLTFIPTTAATNSVLFSFDDASTSNAISVSITGGTFRFTTTVGGSSSSLSSTFAPIVNQPNKVAIAWANGIKAISANGAGPQYNGSPAAFPTTITNVTHGASGAGGQQCNCYLQKEVYAPNALFPRLPTLTQPGLEWGH